MASSPLPCAGEHSNRTCRRLHVVGTTGVVALAAAAAVSQSPSLLLALPLVGYVSLGRGGLHLRADSSRPWPEFLHREQQLEACLAVTTTHLPVATPPLGLQGCAWVGHFWFEHNRPATFRYPLWSLAADFRLWFEVLSGQRAF